MSMSLSELARVNALEARIAKLEEDYRLAINTIRSVLDDRRERCPKCGDPTVKLKPGPKPKHG